MRLIDAISQLLFGKNDEKVYEDYECIPYEFILKYYALEKHTRRIYGKWERITNDNTPSIMPTVSFIFSYLRACSFLDSSIKCKLLLY